MNIVISPFSKKLRNGNRNPKDYPYWKEVVSSLEKSGDSIIQIGVDGEEKLVEDFRRGLPFKEIMNLIKECDLWISVDNFLHHMAHYIGKPGIVIWGISDPKIFGYAEDINIFRDQRFFRPNQFLFYEGEVYDPKVFPLPEKIMESVDSFRGRNKRS